MPGAGADTSIVLVKLSHVPLQTASTGEFLRTHIVKDPFAHISHR